MRKLALSLDARGHLMACEECIWPHRPWVSTALQFGDWGAVGFLGVDLRRRDLLMPAHDSRTRVAPDTACLPERTVKSTLPPHDRLFEGMELADEGTAEGMITPIVSGEILVHTNHRRPPARSARNFDPQPGRGEQAEIITRAHHDPNRPVVPRKATPAYQAF